MGVKSGISVIICCYNASKRLPETLKHLAAQQTDKSLPWELIVVDNASTDDSAEVARTLWKDLGSDVSLRLVHEAVPGLTAARQAGFAEAKYEFLLLCDDDNWLNPDYLQLAYQRMLAQPEIAVLGGKGQLVFEEEPPVWMQAYCVYANGAQAHAGGPARNNRVYGAGCVIRKEALQKLADADFQPILTDRKGSSLASGGDYEYCMALCLAGYAIWYDEELIFRHFVEKQKTDWQHYQRYILESTACFEVFMPYKAMLANRELKSGMFVPQLAKRIGYHAREISKAWLHYKQQEEGSKAFYLAQIRYRILTHQLNVLIRSIPRMEQHYRDLLAFRRRLLQLDKLQPSNTLKIRRWNFAG